MVKDTIKSGRSKKRLRMLLYILPLLALIAFGGFYFKKYNDLKKNPGSADQIAQAEIDRYISEVGKLYALPQDEKPSVATVKDKEKLKDQPFFAKAENNDVTLIYTDAKLAILYRPSTKQIINVSSVTIEATKPVVKVIGSGRSAVEQKLNSNFSNDVTVSQGANAKNSYTEITVVDLTGQQSELAKKLADDLGGKVGSLPSGEDRPTGVDILVIAGTP